MAARPPKSGVREARREIPTVARLEYPWYREWYHRRHHRSFDVRALEVRLPGDAAARRGPLGRLSEPSLRAASLPLLSPEPLREFAGCPHLVPRKLGHHGHRCPEPGAVCPDSR
jgi:hypothetical protein